MADIHGRRALAVDEGKDGMHIRYCIEPVSSFQEGRNVQRRLLACQGALTCGLYQRAHRNSDRLQGIFNRV